MPFRRINASLYSRLETSDRFTDSVIILYQLHSLHSVEWEDKSRSSWDVAIGYGLDDRGFNSRGEQENFLHHVQTSSGAHPASYPVGTGDSFARVKRWSMKLTF